MLCLGLVAPCVAGASASTFAEVPDAGQSLGTAQALGGGVDTITGSLSGDADMFSFYWGGGDFYVNSVGTPWDSQLFLFNGAGQGVQANDDGIAFAGPAYLQLSGLAAGFYYLAITSYNLDPYSAAGLMFSSNTAGCPASGFGCLEPPLNDGSLDHWAGTSYHSGDYQINFSTTTSDGHLGNPNPTGAPVPEPGTLLLVGSALVTAASRLRKS